MNRPGNPSRAGLRAAFQDLPFVKRATLAATVARVGIPVKLNAHSGGNPNVAFRDEPEHHRSVATLASRLCKKCSASSRETCPERSKGGTVAARMGVWGKGQQSLAPPQHSVTRSASSASAGNRGLSQLPGAPKRAGPKYLIVNAAPSAKDCRISGGS
jgi:hypothetical protein